MSTAARNSAMQTHLDVQDAIIAGITTQQEKDDHLALLANLTVYVDYEPYETAVTDKLVTIIDDTNNHVIQ